MNPSPYLIAVLSQEYEFIFRSDDTLILKAWWPWLKSQTVYIPSEYERFANIAGKMGHWFVAVWPGLIDQNAKQRLDQRQWIPADCGKPVAITTTGCEASVNLKITDAMKRSKDLNQGD